MTKKTKLELAFIAKGLPTELNSYAKELLAREEESTQIKHVQENKEDRYGFSTQWIPFTPSMPTLSLIRFKKARLEDEETFEQWFAEKGSRFCNQERFPFLPSEHKHSFWRKANQR